MRLRPYIPEKDFDRIKGWIADPRTHAFWCGNRFEYPLSEGNFNETLRGFAVRRGDVPFVAVGDDGAVTGFFSYSLQPETNEGLLAFVVVDPARRGQGLGKAMLQLALDYAFRISKADAVHLRVFAENTRAVKCYESVGFIQEKADPGAFAYENESWERRSMGIRRTGAESHPCGLYTVHMTGLQIGAVVWGVRDVESAVAFWSAALDYEVKYHAPDDFAILKPKTGNGVQLSISKVTSEKAKRHHLDLFAENQQAEVERLLALGATRKEWNYPADADYVVLQDPDGNPFCVVQA